MQRQQLQNNRKESPCDEPEVVLCRRAVPQNAQGPSGGLELSPGGALKVCFSRKLSLHTCSAAPPRPPRGLQNTSATQPPPGHQGAQLTSARPAFPSKPRSAPLPPRSCLWVPTGCGLRTPPLVRAGRVLFSRGHTRTPRQILPLGFKTGHCHGWKFLDLV